LQPTSQRKNLTIVFMDKAVIETDFEKAKQWPGCEYLGDDLLLIDQLAAAPFPKEPRRMNFILLGLCTKGSVSYRMDMKEQLLTPGHIIIASDRHLIDHYHASSDLEGLCMMVSVPFYNEIMSNVSDLSALFLFAHNHPIFPFSKRDQQLFQEYFHVIRTRIGLVGNQFRRELVRTLMLAMFYDLATVVYQYQQVPDVRQNRADAIFTRFIRLVEENCKHNRRVSWYAEQLCLTPKYLSEVVKLVSMRTPNQWIDNYVVLELRVLLKNTTKSVKDIAEEMHFPNQSFLGKYFKEHVGMSPSEYRKS